MSLSEKFKYLWQLDCFNCRSVFRRTLDLVPISLRNDFVTFRLTFYVGEFILVPSAFLFLAREHARHQVGQCSFLCGYFFLCK